MSSSRVALFVEGSFAPPPPRGERPLTRLWNGLARTLGIDDFEPIVPISKKHVVAMDPSKPKMSGAGEPLDALMARVQRTSPFDAALVAWDLVPAWASDGDYCRWREVTSFYHLLSQSQHLDESWRVHAKQRLRDVSRRHASFGPLTHGVLALCMEPMFESILVHDGSAIQKALGLKQAPPHWPRRGWGEHQHRPDRDLLKPAIASLYRQRPRPPVCRKVRGDFETNKDGWGEYILRRLLEQPDDREVVLRHPISVRLRKWLHERTTAR